MADKLNENQANSVSLEMLTTEAKTAMTGGSVAVVGSKSVSFVNLASEIQDDIGGYSPVVPTILSHGYDAVGGFAVINSSVYFTHTIIPVTEGETWLVNTTIANAALYGILLVDDSFSIKASLLKGTGTGVD